MIDLRIVNDFANNKEFAIFKDFARGISEIDRALHAVTKTKLFRQAHGRVTRGDDATRAAYFFDNVAPIVRLDLLLHGSHYIGGTQVDFLPRCCAAGYKIRAHTLIAVIPGGVKRRGSPGQHD